MNNQAAQTMPELPKAWGFARNVDGQIEIRIGPVCPPNRSGGLATPWAPMFGGDQMHQYASDYAASLSQTAGVVEVARVCKWHQQDEGYDTFSTGCGHEYTVNECTDGNVQLPYCPFCAKPLIGIAWNEDDDVSLSEALSSPDAAAPAASGGEDGLVAGIMAHFCNAIDNLNDMPVSDEWAKKWTAKAEFLIGMGPDPGNQSLSDTPSQTPAASVSERARTASLKEIVPAEKRNYLDDNGNPRSIEDEAYAHGWNACRAATLRALEQALTQQRGSLEFWERESMRCLAYDLRNMNAVGFSRDTCQDAASWLEKLSSATTPQPGADAVRELVQRWRDQQITVPPAPHGSPAKSYNCALRACADELESLLGRGGK